MDGDFRPGDKVSMTGHVVDTNPRSRYIIVRVGTVSVAVPRTSLILVEHKPEEPPLGTVISLKAATEQEVFMSTERGWLLLDKGVRRHPRFLTFHEMFKLAHSSFTQAVRQYWAERDRV